MYHADWAAIFSALVTFGTWYWLISTRLTFILSTTATTRWIQLALLLLPTALTWALVMLTFNYLAWVYCTSVHMDQSAVHWSVNIMDMAGLVLMALITRQIFHQRL